MICLNATYYTDLAVAYLRGQAGLADHHLLKPDELVAKYVRADHIRTRSHWFHGQPVTPNQLQQRLRLSSYPAPQP